MFAVHDNASRSVPSGGLASSKVIISVNVELLGFILEIVVVHKSRQTNQVPHDPLQLDEDC